MTLQLLPISVFALLLALIMARPLSALLLGDDSARALGHNPTLTRSIIALTVTLMSGIAVALAGPLVFLGIVAPYAARHIVGPRIASQILLAALIGALVLLSADILARLVIRPFDSPVGVILAFIGAPFLILLVRSSKVSTI
jgi:iron complex transport system permease protein